MANTTLNTAPIYTASGDTQWVVSATTANTTKDLTTGTIFTAFTASATGGYVQRIRFKPLGTNVATVARVWINDGDANAVASNNTLWDDISLPPTTNSEVSAQPTFELPLNIALPANYKILVTLGTAVAAGYTITVIGGKY
jgi:hypothetical protein